MLVISLTMAFRSLSYSWRPGDRKQGAVLYKTVQELWEGKGVLQKDGIVAG